MNKLTITVKQKGNDIEGSYQLPGSTAAKISNKDGKTTFPNRGSLTQAAKKLAKVFNWETEFVQPQKKAAKKSLKVTKTSTPKPQAKSCTKAQAAKPQAKSCTKAQTTKSCTSN